MKWNISEEERTADVCSAPDWFFVYIWIVCSSVEAKFNSHSIANPSFVSQFSLFCNLLVFRFCLNSYLTAAWKYLPNRRYWPLELHRARLRLVCCHFVCRTLPCPRWWPSQCIWWLREHHVDNGRHRSDAPWQCSCRSRCPICVFDAATYAILNYRNWHNLCLLWYELQK